MIFDDFLNKFKAKFYAKTDEQKRIYDEKLKQKEIN